MDGGTTVTLPQSANAELPPELSSLIAAARDGDASAVDRLEQELRARHRIDRRHPAGEVLARWWDVSSRDLESHPDGVAAVHRGELDGFVIRGVLAPDEAADFAKRTVESGLLHDNVGGRLLGTSLLGLPDRSTYYPAAATTRRQLDELSGSRFQSRIEDVLRRLGGGRNVELPREAPDETYLPATVRVLGEHLGGYRAHTGNEFVESYGSYDHLRSIAHTTDALSYFVLLQKPVSGGELVLYDLAWADTPPQFHDAFMSSIRDAWLEQYPKAYVDPDPGDMILFNGGRIWHKVADIEGPTSRITVGGFATLSKDDSTVYYWN
jgi:hypothetical protein